MLGAEHVGDHYYLEMLLRVPNQFHFWAWEYILLLSGRPAGSRYLSCHCHQVNAGQWRMDWRCWVCKPPTATSLILCVNEGSSSELPLLPGQCWTRMDWQATATVFFQYLNECSGYWHLQISVATATGSMLQNGLEDLQMYLSRPSVSFYVYPFSLCHSLAHSLNSNGLAAPDACQQQPPVSFCMKKNQQPLLPGGAGHSLALP